MLSFTIKNTKISHVKMLNETQGIPELFPIAYINVFHIGMYISQPNPFDTYAHIYRYSYKYAHPCTHEHTDIHKQTQHTGTST